LINDGTNTGFALATYTSPHETPCPISSWEISSSSSSVVSVSGLSANPTGSASSKVVIPTDTSAHASYTFYVKASTLGNSNAFFGPYIMEVGCVTTTALGIAVGSGFTTVITTVKRSSSG
tara:strand:- start:171 stop:530 length:360 start_codon:yes stop_codon:yes gene_type:complete